MNDGLREALVGLPDIDHEIVDWLAAINEYQGVVTLNSCAGHKDREGKGDPFVVLRFVDDSFYQFCRLLAPVGDESSPLLVLWSGKSMVTVSPPEKDARRLAEARKELFERIIETLEKMKEKASSKEIELKIRLVRSCNQR